MEQLPPDDPTRQWCEDCEGSGQLSCEECGGDGTRNFTCDRGYDHEEDCDCCDCGLVECGFCEGTGMVINEDFLMDDGL